MIEIYLIICLSFGLMTVLTIHTQAFKLYRAFLRENKILPKHHINKGISAVIFFITTTVLAPLVAIPFVIKPNAVIRGYTKALISTAEM